MLKQKKSIIEFKSKSIDKKELKICLVTAYLPGHFADNYSSLFMIAEWLANAGHSVSILSNYLHDFDTAWIKKWRSKDRNKFIQLISLNYQGPLISSLLAATQSYHILEWMLEHAYQFDIVHFPLINGLAYYTLLAKHQGWAFQHIQFFLDIRTPTIWIKHVQQQRIDQIDDLVADFLEKESVRLADLIISQDHKLLEWMKNQNWQLSKQVHTLPQLNSNNPNYLLKEEIKIKWLNLYEGTQIKKSYSQQSIETFLVKEKKHQPLVSICLIHFNRPHYLAQVLESIRMQDYSNFEVILIDDASTLPEADVYLKSLAPEFDSKGWQIIRNKTNNFPGAARNLAVRKSRGEYLLFMDDDNYAKPNQITTFIRVAKQVHADILTCAMDVFEGPNTPSDKTKLIHRFLPLGAAVGLGLYLNIFGDMNALIKKKTYEALNGLTEDHGIGGEDWELFSRAVLKGYHLETIPLSLFWYRNTPYSITKTTRLNENCLRGIRSYLDIVPSVLYDNIILAQVQQEKLNQLLRDYHDLGKLLKRCWQLFTSRIWYIIFHPRKTIKRLFMKFRNNFQ